jgi:signal transduction histidine kinase
MGVEIRIVLGPWSDIRRRLEAGEIDAVQGMFYSPERAAVFAFSVPHEKIAHTVFIGPHSPAYRGPESLRDARVAVMKGDIMHDYAIQQKWGNPLLAVKTEKEALELLARSGADFVLGAHLPGMYWIREKPLQHVQPIRRTPLLDPEYAYAVRQANAAQLELFNDGLALLKANGEYKAIRDRWLGVLEPGIPWTRIARYSSLFFGAAVLLLGLAVVWAQMLKTQVARKTSALEESERKRRLVFETMPDGFALYEVLSGGQGRPSGYRHLEVNPSYAALVGAGSANELTGRLAEELRAPLDPAWLSLFDRVATTGQAETLQSYTLAHGRHFQVRAFRPLPGQLAVLFEDISERRKMEHEIAQLARFPAENPNPVIRLSFAGELLYANKAADPLVLQLKKEEGRILATNFEHSYAELLATGKVHQLEFACGETTYALTLAPLPEEGELNLYALDISDRKQAERRLAETLEHLKISNRDLEQFAYIASHDLQEPLRMVANYMQLIERRYTKLLDSDGRTFIAFAADGAVRMQKLIDSLLEYSRLQTRKRPLEPVQLDAVLRQILTDMESAVLEADATLTVGPLPEVTGDAVQLGQVFQNLISNALKFRGKEPPVIHIAAEELPDHWKLTVRDNGIGIEPEHQERIFKIFQRLHSRAEYPGTGIGLAICRRVIERHGGKTGVESAPEQGSIFWFTLPKKGEPNHGRV